MRRQTLKRTDMNISSVAYSYVVWIGAVVPMPWCVWATTPLPFENNSVCDNDALYAIMDYMCSPAPFSAIILHTFSFLFAAQKHAEARRVPANRQRKIFDSFHVRLSLIRSTLEHKMQAKTISHFCFWLLLSLLFLCMSTPYDVRYVYHSNRLNVCYLIGKNIQEKCGIGGGVAAHLPATEAVVDITTGEKEKQKVIFKEMSPPPPPPSSWMWRSVEIIQEANMCVVQFMYQSISSDTTTARKSDEQKLETSATSAVNSSACRLPLLRS